MGYLIQRQDGTTGGLGDRVVFGSEAAAWDAARTAFGRDPASDEGGVESWLEVVEAPRCVAPTGDEGLLCGDHASEERTVEGVVVRLCAEHAREIDEEGDPAPSSSRVGLGDDRSGRR